jgi:hypothetical protein
MRKPSAAGLVVKVLAMRTFYRLGAGATRFAKSLGGALC